MARPRAHVPPMAAPPKRRRRPTWHKLDLTHQPEAAEFSSDDEIMDVVELIRTLKANPQFAGPLAAGIGLVKDDGLGETGRAEPGRKPIGIWELLYLAFVASRDPAVQSFWNRWRSSPIWEECGFEERPPYITVWYAFARLEKDWEVFRSIGHALVRQARRHRREIGTVLHVDATSFQSNAILEHCCTDRNACKALQRTTGESWGKVLDSASEDDIKKLREEDAAAPEPDEGEEDNPKSAVAFEGADELYSYFEFRGHLFRCRDTSAGVRSYIRPNGKRKTWIGGLALKAVDHHLGIPVEVLAFRADENEYDHYEELLDGATQAIGDSPLAVTLDRGNTNRKVYRINTLRKIATVGPWRKRRGKTDRIQMRCDLFDEHGIPRCQHCGGEGDQDGPGYGLDVDLRSGRAWINFRCHDQYLPACKRKQRIDCAEEWTMLIPLSRVNPLYHDLRKLHGQFERIFDSWRDRYGVAGANATSRLKRRGVGAQRLRCSAALLLDWFRACLRHGWLGTWRTINTLKTQSDRGSGHRRLAILLKARRKRGLDLPYGEAAKRLGIAKRAGPAPPAPTPTQPPDVPF